MREWNLLEALAGRMVQAHVSNGSDSTEFLRIPVKGMHLHGWTEHLCSIAEGIPQG